ncbi:hypothetical protein [Methanosphaerula palustris]|nr:hypothetical protein [Methanosphaerula palustris]
MYSGLCARCRLPGQFFKKGDFRDWHAIDDWAKGIALALKSSEP